MTELELEEQLRGAACRFCGERTLYWDHDGRIWCASCEAYHGIERLHYDEAPMLPLDQVLTLD